MSSLVRAGLDNLWEKAIHSPFYHLVTTIGCIIAVLFIGLFAAKWLKTATEHGMSLGAFQELLFPILVVILLSQNSGNTTLFGQYTQTTWEITAGISDLIISSLRDEILNSASVVTEAGVKGAAQMIANDAIKECSTITEKEPRSQCFDNAYNQVFSLLDPYKDKPWTRELAQELKAKIAAAWGPDFSNWNWVPRVVTPIGGMVNSSFITTAMGALLVAGTAWQWCLEMTAILTAVMGPIFLGASLLPIDDKPIFDWLSSFLGIGIARLSYNILIALTATTIIDSNINTPPMILPIIAGFFGIGISLYMGLKGGVAIAGSLSRISSFVTGRFF
jgi:hypothetical protein